MNEDVEYAQISQKGFRRNLQMTQKLAFSLVPRFICDSEIIDFAIFLECLEKTAKCLISVKENEIVDG